MVVYHRTHPPPFPPFSILFLQLFTICIFSLWPLWAFFHTLTCLYPQAEGGTDQPRGADSPTSNDPLHDFAPVSWLCWVYVLALPKTHISFYTAFLVISLLAHIVFQLLAHLSPFVL